MNKHVVKAKVRNTLTGKPRKVMLNVGCGTDYKAGWINIDNNSDNNIDKLDLNWDLRNPLPFENGSVDYIFNEHLIEHLTVDEGQAAIKDFMRVLKSGGVLRIATPDLEDAVAMYLDPNWKTAPTITNVGLGFVKTKAELLNMSFSWWGHKWIYDIEELQRRLHQAGCMKVEQCKHGKSSHADLQGLEIRQESTLVVEVTK